MSTHNIQPLIYRYQQLHTTDVSLVGGKNASLGEMLSRLSESGIRVPDGFATSAQFFRDFYSRMNSMTQSQTI